MRISSAILGAFALVVVAAVCFAGAAVYGGWQI